MRTLAVAARESALDVQQRTDLSDRARASEYRQVLRDQVHLPVRKLTVAHTQPQLSAVADLAAVVRELIPEGTELEMHPRGRVFVSLLRGDFLEAAWTLAHDNASGVLPPERSVNMWAGGSFLKHELPLPAHIEGSGEAATVHAWLPGFRDPRWGVPDEVYSIDRDVFVRGRLDEAVLNGGVLRLRGSAYLRMLNAAEADIVTLNFSAKGGKGFEVRATRARRTDYTQDAGPELSRLAWSGWHLQVDAARLLATPATWSARMTVEHRGLVRHEPVGLRRGPLAAVELLDRPQQVSTGWLKLTAADNGALRIKSGNAPRVARLLPAPARATLRKRLR